MTRLIITRHAGAVEWLRRHHPALVEGAEVVSHFGPEEIARLGAGDAVIGVLPLGLVAELNKRGIRTFLIDVRVPRELRGKELTAEDMEALGATVEETVVLKGQDLDRAREQWVRVIEDTGAPFAPPHPLFEG